MRSNNTEASVKPNRMPTASESAEQEFSERPERVRKSGLVPRLIMKATLWYPLKITLLVIWKCFSFALEVLLTGLIVGVITGVVVACAFLLYIKSNIVSQFDGLDNLKFDASLNTTIYYTDEAGNEILMEEDTLHGSENRLWAEYSELPQYLIDAIISIEDERYITHNGVDIKRTLGAVLNYFMPGGDSYGGSTITQQLIKNVSQDDDATIQRKVQEIFRALYVEKKFSKEEILEMYLNVIYLSQNTNGVKAAARLYFGKELSQLSLVECTAIAAIPKYPTYYDPKRNPDNNLQRRNVILNQMLKLGYIDQEEHDAAYNVPLYLIDAVETETEEYTETVHSYYVDAAIDSVTRSLMEHYNIDMTTASRKLYSGGLQIVLNMDPYVQGILEEVFCNEECFPHVTGIKPQAAMTVMDPTTGEVLGIIGGRGEKTVSRGLNRATQSTRQCGSSIKPLSVYAYAIDRGLLTYASSLTDLPIEFDEEEETYWPGNTPAGFDGIISLVSAVKESKNTTAVRLVSDVGVANSFNFMVNKLGISTLIESRDYGGVIKSDVAVAPLALGAFTEGVTVYDITQGYTMFANGGAVSEARIVSLVRDSNGEIILDNRTPVQTQAISEQSAYIMTKILETVVGEHHGTAWYMFVGASDSPKFKPKVDVAGKTGSTNDDRDRYFVGYTPEYVASVWFGYDNSKSLSKMTYNPAVRLWIEVFNRIYESLDERGRSYKKTFEEPYGIVTAEYCTISGKLATDACRCDLQYILDPEEAECVRTGYFTYDTVPTEFCDKHIMFKFDKDTQALCLEGCDCPAESLIDVSLRLIEPRVFLTNLKVTDAQYTCVDMSLLGEGYVYPTSTRRPYFFGFYEPKTYPGRSNSSTSAQANRICLTHYHPEQ